MRFFFSYPVHSTDLLSYFSVEKVKNLCIILLSFELPTSCCTSIEKSDRGEAAISLLLNL